MIVLTAVGIALTALLEEKKIKTFSCVRELELMHTKFVNAHEIKNVIHQK